MPIKDQTMTTDVDAAGNEYVSELNATYTETLADGTQVEAEITTTAAADDPTQIESHATITEIAPDGTETVTEVVANEDGTFIVEEESALEEMVESAFGVEIDNNLTPITPDGQTDTDAETDVFLAESDAAQNETEAFETESEFETAVADFTVGDEMFNSTVAPTDTGDVFNSETPFDSTYGTTDTAYTAIPVAETPYESPVDSQIEAYNRETSEAEAAEIAEQEAHAQAATDAQNAADEFIAKGDYAAAAEARETAENEAWEAGDDSMLSAYDAGDLTHAADKQEQAEYYNELQAQFAQEGNYEAARDAADRSAYATSEADFSAGGDDHTGQAEAERYNMDWAVHEEKQADYYADGAATYAADGDFEKAESYAASAVYHQDRADNFGDLGEHGGDIAVYDPSSEVASGGSYDSSYDAAAVDTGFDASVDTTAATSYDTGTDEV
jgi:hypothetical protein